MITRSIIFPPRPTSSGPVRALRAAAAATLGPICTAGAWALGAPGMSAHVASLAMGLRLVGRADAFPRSMSLAMIAWPLDSTRYAEFDFATREIERLADGLRYLDVSSPRLLPALVLSRHAATKACIMNPDGKDLALTRGMLGGLGLSSRCAFVEDILTPRTAPAGAFDVVTCMSVLEHIPEDGAAMRVMWDALAPGGTLLLTVPCQAEPEDQFTNLNQYGVLRPGDDGLVFRQRLYSTACLESRIYAITGSPAHAEFWGERERGFIQADTMQKWTSLGYPFYAEALTARRHIVSFARLDDMPGEGVACLRFEKRA